MNKNVYEKIEEEFLKRLETKTSWGKEELKKMYTQVKADVALQVLNETTQPLT